MEDDIGDAIGNKSANKINEFSRVINNPSAEGFLAGAENFPSGAPPL